MVVAAAMLIAAIGVPRYRAAEAAASLDLSPSAGEPPSASGDLSGSGWECSPGVVPSGAATVSGGGAGGSAVINRDGTVSGSFDVRGSAGDRVTITVTANTACPTIGPPTYLKASAVFRFNEAPPPTRTPRPPSATPIPPTSTPPPAAPSPTSAPPPPTTAPPPLTVPPAGTASVPTRAAPPTSAATSLASPAPTAGPTQTPPGDGGGDRLRFGGCAPSSPVELEFVPLYLLGIDPANDTATGPSTTVPAVQSPDAAGGFAFVPPVAEPGRVFRVTAKTDDAGCKAESGGAADYWIAGQDLIVPMVLPGDTTLQVCSIGDKTPCEFPVVKGAFVTRDGALPEPADAMGAPEDEGGWTTEDTYWAEDLKKGPFRFRSSMDLMETGQARLQASVLPFPQTLEDDPMAPAGLVQSWDINCVNCEFTVDLSGLAPKMATAGDAWYEVAGEWVFNVGKGGVKKIGDALAWVGGLVGIGGGGGDSDDAVAEAVVVAPPPGSLPGEYLVGKPVPLPAPTTFYFRILPLDPNDSSKVSVAPSNAVRLQRVEKPEPIKITSTATPTPMPGDLAYEVDIVSYHGILPPVVSTNTCYIATADAWVADPFGLTYTTDKSKSIAGGAPAVKAGQLFCKPAPQEPSLFEAIVSWAESAVNWASEAWSDLKAFAVDTILKFTPLGMQCSIAEDAGAIPEGACETAFAVALDAALVSLGIPPDIPNFDQLVDQGVTYLAAEVAAQVGIPPDVVQAAVEEGGPYAGLALSVAEAELREELQKEIEGQMKDAVRKIQLGYAASVAWVPDGIPVRPDDYQPPAATVRVTRKPGAPGGDAGCTLTVADGLTLSKQTLENPDPAWASFVEDLPTDLSQLTSYDFLANEGDLGSQGFPGGADKKLHVPPLAAGESYLMPMTFKPNYYKNGWHPLGLVPTDTYISVWYFMHEFGTLHLSAHGCGSDALDVPAKANVVGAEVQP